MAEEVLYIHEEEIHNKRAAQLVLPFVFKLHRPASVIDIGCGLGTWLSVCQDLGVDDILGVDGDYVDQSKLAIPETKFVTKDLRQAFEFDRKFDLVICLEVAEHLPEPSADKFVSSLATLGDQILFSAAIPGQSGQNHLNEQWPDYWEKKFNSLGFYFHDIIRPEFWNNAELEVWYRQNIFLVNRQKSGGKQMLSLVHPKLFSMQMSIRDEYVQSLEAGRHGIWISFQIFLKSIKVRIANLFK